MSRVGRQIINIPDKTEISESAGLVTVKGPKGSLVRQFKTDMVAIKINGREVTLSPLQETVDAKAMWGTYASHIKNMVTGVTTGYTKKLIIEGIGFKVALKGQDLVLDIGFSHEVNLPIPAGITVQVEKNLITISGFDKEALGEFAAKVRSYKRTEPYKGKGIRYEGEAVRRKQGKKTVS